MAGKQGQRTWGSVRKLPSKRWQAEYPDPDGRTYLSAAGNPRPVRHVAPTTFDSKLDAEAWLTDERRLVSAGTWTSPTDRLNDREANRQAAATRATNTFSDYAERWITERKVKGQPLAARTRDHYLSLLAHYLAPTFGPLPLEAITPQAVNVWYDALTPVRKRTHGSPTTGGTTKAHTYALGRAIMTTATSVHGPLVGHVNPFAIRGGGSTPATKRTELVSSGQLKVIQDTIRPEWRAMVSLALWTGLRFSELAELRRSDIDLEDKMIRVRRSVARSKVDGVHVKGPKSEAGVRDREIPDAVIPALTAHLRTYVTGRDGLLFPGKGGQHLAPSTFYGGVTCSTCKKVPALCARLLKDGKTEDHVFEPRESGWYAARTAAGCPEIHFHDLRATGATLMAQQGATEAEIMEWLGDSTPQAAQRYVRAARSRMRSHANAMSRLAEGGDW